jgi:hypothetical protein
VSGYGIRTISCALFVCLAANNSALAVVISEIYYHPTAAEGQDLEFIELHEPTEETVSLAGWRLLGAVEFTFSADTILAGGGYVVICRDRQRFEQRFQFTSSSVLGDFSGALSDRGETVLLVDDTGAYVDAVAYDDEAPWPLTADGTGAALERRCPRGKSDDHLSWRAVLPTPLTSGPEDCGAPADGSPRVVISEIYYHPARLSSWVAPGDDGEGSEFVEFANPGAADVDLGGWRLRGVGFEFPAGTILEPGEFLAVARHPEAFAEAFQWQESLGGFTGRLANSGERLTLEDAGGVVIDSVFYGETDPWPYEADGGGKGLEKIVLTSDGAEPANWRASDPSPGAANAAAGIRHPPSVTFVRHFPQQPRELESVIVSARVEGAPDLPPPLVQIVHNAGAARFAPNLTLRMADDGLSGDGEAGDGVYGARLPPFAHNTQVRFRVVATQEGLTTESPVPAQPGAPRSDEVWGFYVDDHQTESDLPTYHILLDGVDGSLPGQVNDALQCERYAKASFAFDGHLYPDVDVRFRGNTMCVVEKRNFKIRFRSGRLFHGRRKVNLNSLWTDKSLVREHLAWSLQRELGLPYCETQYARLNVSGSYYGLYLELEHPDERFLKRNGLDDHGTLYKATDPTPGELRVGVAEASLDGYQRLWESETSPTVDYGDLADFVDAMHSTGGGKDGPSVDFWQERSFEDSIVAYQTGQVLLNNMDGARKNHFLYHDLSEDRWTILPWDLDLSFGKYFAGCAVDLAVGRRVGTLNDVMLCAPRAVPAGCEIPSSLDPWFATTVLVPPPRNWLVDYFFRSADGYYQRAYLKNLWDALRDKYRPDLYRERVEELAGRIAEEVEEDLTRWGRYPSNLPDHPADMTSHLEILIEQVECHRASLLKYLARAHPMLSHLPVIKFTEIHYAPVSGRSEGEFLELANLSEAAVDLSGWTIDGGVRYVFPVGSRVARGEVFLVAASPQELGDTHHTQARVFGPYEGKLSSSGETLALRDAGPGHPAVVDRVTYGADGEWPKLVPGESIELPLVHVDTDNDRAEDWRASRLGGTPGVIFVRFVRGDTNQDGRVNISDALVVIGYLFRDGAPLSCLDAADSDDSGRVDLTDAIFFLNHLFLGGPPPPPPYPQDGPDPTPDELECAAR